MQLKTYKIYRLKNRKNGLMRTLSSFIIGLISSSLILYIEFQNNNQGEYIDYITEKVDYIHAIKVFIVPFIIITLFSLFFLNLLFSLLKKNRG